MKWFDFVVLGVMLGIIILQTTRAGKGMGLILLEAIGLMGCARLAISIYEPISQSLAISKPLAFTGIFVLCGIIWIVMAAILNNLTQWSWGQFDNILGFFFGVVCAWTIGFMFLRGLVLYYGPESTTAGKVVESPVTKEVMNFRTINSLFNLLNRARIAEEPTTPEKVLERK